MAGEVRWLGAMMICLLVLAGPLRAQDNTQPAAAPPSTVTEDEGRLLELGQLCMGQNNPAYALQVQDEVEDVRQLLRVIAEKPPKGIELPFFRSCETLCRTLTEKHLLPEPDYNSALVAQRILDNAIQRTAPDDSLLDSLRQLRARLGDFVTKYYLSLDARNAAGEQALRTFRSLAKLHPEQPEGWFWLGITLTETLRYSREYPDGREAATEETITEGLQAFRTAYERKPTELVYISYYGEALVEYRKDFDAVRSLWETFLKTASTDILKVTALVQAARACLNKAYFGKSNKMPPDEIKANYTLAFNYVEQAARICPKAEDVREMQALLRKYRKELLGS